MMLAGIQDYMQSRQLLLLLMYLAIWLTAGPFLTRWALRRLAGLPKSKSSTARSAWINILAGGGAMVAAGVVAGFFLAMASEFQHRWLAIGGAALAPFAMLGMSWIIHLTLLDRPPKLVLKITLAATGPLLVILAAVGTAAAVPAWYSRQAQLKENRCQRNLFLLSAALESYSARYPGSVAPDLQTLVKTGFVKPENTRCPANPDDADSYIYVKTPAAKQGTESVKIRICDREGNHGNIRKVLLTDGRVLSADPAAFEKLMAMPDNADLRKRLTAQ